MHKGSYKLLCILVSYLLFLGGCSNAAEKEDSNDELLVAAAASLHDALMEVKAEFEENHESIKITYTFGGSGTLQQQISKGAPVDLFFSAASDQFEELDKEGMITKYQNKKLLGNQLVFITQRDNQDIKTMSDLSSASKIALGTPETVPAGQYGKQSLEHLGLWSELNDKMVFTKDVSQVLTYVESKNVDAGLVYLTDALRNDEVKVIETMPDESHHPIIYPVGVLRNSQHKDAAINFFSFLQTDEAMNVFEKHGFKGLK